MKAAPGSGKSLTYDIPVKFKCYNNWENIVHRLSYQGYIMDDEILCQTKKIFHTYAEEWTWKNKDNLELEWCCLVFSVLVCRQLHHPSREGKRVTPSFFGWQHLADSLQLRVASVIYYLFGSYYGNTFSIDFHFCIFS